VELGAFVLIPQVSEAGVRSTGKRKPLNQLQPTAAYPSPLWPVLGKNLLQHWMEKIRRLGIQVMSVGEDMPAGAETLFSNFARQGLERFLVVCLKAYAEIDLTDFVRFHRETRNPITEAIDQEGPLGVRLVDRASFSPGASCARESDGLGRFAEYRFAGYVKRMMSPQSYSDLVSDALKGRCALQPVGSQVGEGVWVGEGLCMARSVRLTAPCYVGSNTILRDCVSVGPFSSVENNCVIDCGTTIESSSVLPQSFLAAGLNVRRSIVDGPYLEHLDTGTTVDLQAFGLGRRVGNDGRMRFDRRLRPQAGNGPATPACAFDVDPISVRPKAVTGPHP